MKTAAAPSAQETRLLTVAEIASWARSAVPGERLVYCTGPAVPIGPSKDKVSDLVRAGVVRPHNRKVEGKLEHFLVKRPDVPAALEPPPASDDAMEAIFEALERCVERRRRAYSLRDLARIARLPTREQARHRLGKLEAAGRISSRIVKAPDGTSWRIVTIGGRATAAPPKEVA